jgi:hypothetical protein
MDARDGAARHRRGDRGRFVALAVAVFIACAVVATWPASRHVDGNYISNTAPGFGEQAGGDYLQLVWNFWLPGHQLQHGRAPWLDPYSFQPESPVRPTLQGLIFSMPFWPIERAFGPSWAYDLLLLTTFLAAGGFTCWWLRSLGQNGMLKINPCSVGRTGDSGWNE